MPRSARSLTALLNENERAEVMRLLSMRGIPTNLERNFLSGGNGELGRGMKVFAAKLDRSAQAEGVRSGDGDETVIRFAHPGND